jgi:hypothetical protein
VAFQAGVMLSSVALKVVAVPLADQYHYATHEKHSLSLSNELNLLMSTLEITKEQNLRNLIIITYDRM